MTVNDSPLYAGADFDAASSTIRRIGLLHADRLTQERAGDSAAAVRDAGLIANLIETMTVAQLRAAVVQLTTPELQPPTAVGRARVDAPAGGPR